MPFSVDLVQGGFCEPRRVLRYANSGEEKPHHAQDLRRNFWLYISMPFSAKIWCKTGFRKPRRVLRYASSGEENSYGAQDLRRNLLFYISCPFSLKIVCKVVFVNPDAYVYTRVRVNKSRMVRKIYAKPSFFAISAVFNSSNLDTPFSCMVTPYSTSASSIVPRRWVIKMNWVFLVIRRTY